MPGILAARGWDALGMPVLVAPTASVRDSYLEGERALCLEEGTSTQWLQEAANDFAAYAERRRQVRELWGVPVTELWFVEGAEYIGTVVIRHHLTPALEVDGGHVGYHVVPSHRRQGHATTMLAATVRMAPTLGITTMVVTCDEDNTASCRTVEANGGVLEDVRDGIARYRLDCTVTPTP